MNKTFALVCALTMGVSACASNKSSSVDSDDAGYATVTPGIADTSAYAAGSEEDFRQNAGDIVYFAYNQYSLTSEAQTVLARQAAWLKQYPDVRMQIAGSADERGTREYNLALGARRAESARQFLMANGVSANQLATVSYGKERPIATGSNDNAWAMNRNAQSSISGRTARS